MSETQPESPLSSLSSSDEVEDQVSTPNRSARPSIDTDSAGPPAKKRRTGGPPPQVSSSSSIATPAGGSIMTTGADHGEDTEAEISCDSEGSAPGSPSNDEFAMRADQVTTCAWEGCSVGDLANSDELITHVQNDHIAPKRARYTCEWGDCARKGTNHPSGYALKAHMRSHTKEKPFFCHLPECDRSFTRSDALAKHMRTVHEPEPPRASQTNANPIDPATGQPKKGPKLRLSMNGKAALKTTPAAEAPAHMSAQAPNDPSPPIDNICYVPACHPVTGQPGFMITYPPDIHFSQYESEIPANQLMRLLRRQIHWAEQEGNELKSEIEELEKAYRQEWAAKEALLDGVLETEFAHDDDLLRDMKEDVWGSQSNELDWTNPPDLKQPNIKSTDDDIIMQDDATSGHIESTSQADRDDMMAVDALMGLSNTA